MNRQPVEPTSAWKASDFTSKSDITVTLTPGDLDGLDLALETVRDKPPETVERRDFTLGSMGPRLDGLREEVLHGRGIVVLRGLPVDRYTGLLRLWLKVDGARPLAEGVRRYYREDGIEPNSNSSTVYVHEKA